MGSSPPVRTSSLNRVSVKKAADQIKAEEERVEGEISNLRLTMVKQGNSSVTVRHVLYSPMLKEKVPQHIVDTTAASNRFICGAHPTEMSNLSMFESKLFNEEAIQLGLLNA
ncbi:hypothetical protein Trydic_g21154 [Trypoxylus dichotomus]